VSVNPVGVLDFVSVTGPAKPPRLFSVIIEFAELPNGNMRLVGFVVTVKSGDWALKYSVIGLDPAS